MKGERLGMTGVFVLWCKDIAPFIAAYTVLFLIGAWITDPILSLMIMASSVFGALLTIATPRRPENRRSVYDRY